ncbi:MAG: nucleotidyl transferase AbiEii/AbiGii toxin family protein [Deltaproteobacteria bacterium]|nr:nucleotidyl transferase AbiEii/AbiGii toxin family protein [Deltaproteobacteria bacterium]
MGSSRISPLQRDLLQAFFERERGFVLTGGTALGGFHLGHRESKDLDLFGRPPLRLEGAELALKDAARACGAVLSTQIRYDELRRFLAERGHESTLVDLVIDRAPVIDPDPVEFGRILVHSKREIAANKLCTLLSRCEIRDLVDVKALLESGIQLEQALDDAENKDGGMNPATLGWILSELSIAPDAPIAGGVDAADLDRFRRDLVQKLRTLALPKA